MATASFEQTLDQQQSTKNVPVLTVQHRTALDEDEPVTESITDKVRKVVATVLNNNTFNMDQTWSELGAERVDVTEIIINVEEWLGIPPATWERNIGLNTATVRDLVTKFAVADAYQKSRQAR